MPTPEKLKVRYAGGISSPIADSLSDDGDTKLVELENGPLRKTVAGGGVNQDAKRVWSHK